MKSILTLIVTLISLTTQAQFVSTNGPSVLSNVGFVWGRSDTGYVTKDENLWRSFDGGKTWKVLSGDLPNQVDPRAIVEANGVLYIGTNNKSRVYSSADWGDNWKAETDGASAIWVPTHATSNGKEVLMGGTTFAPHYFDQTQKRWVSTGLSGVTHALRYVDDKTIIANVGSVSKGSTYISTDHGRTWTKFDSEPWASVLTLTAKVYDYAKIGDRIIAVPSLDGYNPQYTDDMGKTWEKGTGAKLSAVFYYGRKLLVKSDGKVLLNISGGVRESIDSGKTWSNTELYFGGDYALWKNEDVLCGAGSVESGNTTQFGFVSSTLNLADYKSKLFTTTSIYGAEFNAGVWKVDSFKSTHPIFDRIADVNKIEVIGDSIFLCTRNGIVGSADGFSFSSVLKQTGMGNMGTIAKIGNTYVAGTISNAGNREPEMYYSTDDKKTFTKATFTNKISFGAGGTANGFYNIFESNGKVFADMFGGYSRSDDGGKTWTWLGGTNGGNLVTDQKVLVRVADNYFGTKSLQISENDGDDWTKLYDGLPGYSGQSTFALYGNVYSVDNKIYVEVNDATSRRLMLLDVANKKWIETSESTVIPSNAGIVSLVSVNGVMYVSLVNEGVYTLDDEVGFVALEKESVTLYPNPATEELRWKTDFQPQTITIYNGQGQIIRTVTPTGIQSISVVDLIQGVYFIEFKSNQSVVTSSFVKQ